MRGHKISVQLILHEKFSEYHNYFSRNRKKRKRIVQYRFQVGISYINILHNTIIIGHKYINFH